MKLASFEEKVYSFHPTARSSFTQAQEKCRSIGGRLAMLKPQPVSDFIKTQIEEYKSNGGAFANMFWIGLQQVGDDNEQWRWDDGTDLENQFNNQNWYKVVEPGKPQQIREPSQADEKCVSFLTSSNGWGSWYSTNPAFGYWGDSKCSKKQKYICEHGELLA